MMTENMIKLNARNMNTSKIRKDYLGVCWTQAFLMMIGHTWAKSGLWRQVDSSTMLSLKKMSIPVSKEKN